MDNQRDSEVLDGLKEIKDFIDPKAQMSWSTFKRNLLPDLKDKVLIKKGSYVKNNECKYFCFKGHIMAYLLKKRKL